MGIRVFPFNSMSIFDNFVENQNPFRDINVRLNYVENVDRIFSNLLLPGCTKGLVIGRIQSGKTLFFTGLVARFLDHYNDAICIVLAGTKVTLRNQTYDRLCQDLSHESNGLNIISDINKVDYSRKNVVVLVKHYSPIQVISDYLAKYANRSILVIDDESDQHSLNNFNHKNIQTGLEEVTTTNKAILELIYNTGFNTKYVQITATPQAHFLTSFLDAMRPDFVASLPVHSNYFGNRSLFDGKHEILRIIDGNNDLNDFVEFFIIYLYNYSRMNKDGFIKDNYSCFIHVNHLVTENDLLYNLVVEAWRLIVESLNGVNSLYFHSGVVKNYFAWLRSNLNLLEDALDSFVIQRVYDKYDADIDWKDFYSKTKFFCLIGGNKLERGFTIEGLISSYFTRLSKGDVNLDNFEQRCRFFGNRLDIVSYINVTTTPSIIELLNDYYVNEERVFSEIEANGGLVKDVNSLALNLNYAIGNPTRRSVISWPYYFGYLESNRWSFIYFNLKDYKMCMDFFSGLLDLGVLHPDSGGAKMNSHIVVSVEGLKLIELLVNKTVIPKSRDHFKREILKSIINSGNVYKIVLLSALNERERTFDRFEGLEKVPNAVHSSNNTGGYIGDSNILTTDQDVSLQVGNYRDVLTNINLFVLAFKVNN